MDHSGAPVPENVCFFAPPPLEIGTVLTAYTTMKAGAKHPSAIARASYVILWGAICGTLLFIFGAYYMHSPKWLCITMAIVGFAIGAFLDSLGIGIRSCSYVGEKGVVEFSSSEGPEKPALPTLFLFEKAADLRTKIADSSGSRGYLNTEFAFDWTDENGRSVRKFSGTFWSKEHTPNADSPYYIARSAEEAWTQRLFPSTLASIERGETKRFNLTGGNFVELSRDNLDISMWGKKERVILDDLEGIGIEAGIVKFKQTDAVRATLPFGKTGIYQFNYSDLANAKIFFLLVERLADRRVSAPR